MKHALAKLEADLRRASAPRPPSMADYRGTRMNQARRLIDLESRLRSWTKFHKHESPLERVSQENEDKRALGKFHGWIVAARAEAAHVQRVAKAQSSYHPH